MPRLASGGLLAFFLMLLILGAAPQVAQAVPAPASINWRGSPAAFITSLYRSVLGRAPESRQVVAGWARLVTSQPSSRLKVFWTFIKSGEYQRSRWSKQKRSYYVYRKTQQGSRRWRYFAAKYSQSGGQRIAGGPYARGVAVAIVGYYQAWHPRW